MRSLLTSSLVTASAALLTACGGGSAIVQRLCL